MSSYQNLFQNYLVGSKKSSATKPTYNHSICIATQKHQSLVQSFYHVNSTVHNNSIKVDCYTGSWPCAQFQQTHIFKHSPIQEVSDKYGCQN